MHERREKGLCYNCDERYHAGHKCRRPQLFLLDGVDLTAEEEEEEEHMGGELSYAEAQGHVMAISSYSAAATNPPRCIQLRGLIYHQPVLLLVDTGSTSSFISTEVAYDLRLPEENCLLRVKVANGAGVPSLSICRRVPIQLLETMIELDLHKMPLAGCDIILGTDWLRALGRVTLDFDAAVLEYQLGRKTVRLQGLMEDVESFRESRLGTEEGEEQMVLKYEICAKEETGCSATTSRRRRKRWEDIAIEFVEGLPHSMGKSAIMVVTDRLSQYTHFLGIGHPYTASLAAQVFKENVFKLHGVPSTIISSKEPKFISAFWSSFCQHTGLDYALNSIHHYYRRKEEPHVNKILRELASKEAKDWVKWLAVTEFSYNTYQEDATRRTPYEDLYGNSPPRPSPPKQRKKNRGWWITQKAWEDFQHRKQESEEGTVTSWARSSK